MRCPLKSKGKGEEEAVRVCFVLLGLYCGDVEEEEETGSLSRANSSVCYFSQVVVVIEVKAFTQKHGACDQAMGASTMLVSKNHALG